MNPDPVPPASAGSSSPSQLPAPDGESSAGQDAPSLPRWLPLWLFDRVLGALILVFAFLVSSFVIQNSEFWFHLASGRLLAHGEYIFGLDPFCYTTEQIYWVNHSWLYDAGLFMLFQALGAPWLVVLKAVLITSIALLLLSMRMAQGCRAISAGCTGLALLVMSSHLDLQPACLSYLLLTLELWLLWRVQARPPWERLYLAGVLLVIVLWVSLDSWFLLGPLVVGLFWIGSWYDRRVYCPSWLFPASIVVCMLSPHHVHAFTLPAELSSVLWTSGWRLDPRFEGKYLSPWKIGLHVTPAAAFDLAEWAYFVLLGLGALSFLGVRRNLSGWRLAVWLGLAFLSGWQIGLVSFFAVVAAPITAMNFQQRRSERGALGIRLALLGRVALAAGCVGLILMTCRGWLHGIHPEGRRIGWGAQADPSLQRAAEAIAHWRKEGLLSAEDHLFAIHPDAAHYLAWFAPQEKSFLDHRLPLFPQAAEKFRTICRYLNPALNHSVHPNPQEDLERLLPVFHNYNIRYILVYDPDLYLVKQVQGRLVSDGASWTLLRIDGQTALHGWNDGAPDRLARLAFQPARQVFRNDEAEDFLALPETSPFISWYLFGTTDPAPGWELAAAELYLVTLDAQAGGQRPQPDLGRGAAFLATLAGLPALAPGLVEMSTRLAVPLGLQGASSWDGRERSFTLALLAARAARRALERDPEDARAWLALGQAYRGLPGKAGATSPELSLPPLDLLRHVQAVCSLVQASRLAPEDPELHRLLAEVFRQRRYLDQALEHQQLLVEILHQPTRRVDPLKVAHQDQVLEELQTQVREQQTRFAEQATSAGENLVQQARLALALGLPGQALACLRSQASDQNPGPAALALEMEVLLMLGRAGEVSQMLDDRQELLEQGKLDLGWIDIPGAGASGPTLPYRFPAAIWLRLCLHAAGGEYELAESQLAALVAQNIQTVQTDRAHMTRWLGIAIASDLALNAQPRPLLPQMAHLIVRDVLIRWPQRQVLFRRLQAQQTDLKVVAAVLALEQGRPASARLLLEEALAEAKHAQAPLDSFTGGRLASIYLRWLEQAQH